MNKAGQYDSLIQNAIIFDAVWIMAGMSIQIDKITHIFWIIAPDNKYN